MDPETGCGLSAASQKARLLIGTASWFWNSIGWISEASVSMVELRTWIKLTHQKYLLGLKIPAAYCLRIVTESNKVFYWKYLPKLLEFDWKKLFL